MSTDLRNAFDNILRSWGHDIYLRRVTNLYGPNEKPEYANVLEKHTTRHMYPGSRALGSVADEEIEGVLYDYELVYFFRHNVVPASGDLIYEYRERYPKNQTIYKVDLAIPMRGRAGRIVYWVAGVTRESP